MSDTAAALRRKIGSAGDLQSVVRSMKALAASSIGQYENSVRSLGDYYRTVELGLSACFRERGSTTEIAAAARAHSVSAIVFGSDQGLVGQFNANIVDYAVKALAAMPAKAKVWAVGERVHARLADAGLAPLGLLALPNSVEAIAPLVGQLQIESETQGQHSDTMSLWVFYNRPLPGALYQPAGQRLLPLDALWQRNLAKIPWPSVDLPEVLGTGITTLQALVREYMFISLFRACAESLASENASRLAAMQRADKTIDDLLDSLRAESNRLRQSSIDEELFDVIAGFEALAGAA